MLLMNVVETFGDFIHNYTSEMISYAYSMTIFSSPLQSVHNPTASNSTANEALQISIQIKNIKRFRFEFLNEGQENRLRLDLHSHEPILDDSRLRAYFGHFSIRSNGRRSSSNCS